MVIAKIENGQVVALADKAELFPHTSFPTTGPDDAWYVENSCMKVNLSAPCNRETQVLEPCEPYILDGFVYTNKAVPKPEPVIVQATQDTGNDAITI